MESIERLERVSRNRDLWTLPVATPRSDCGTIYNILPRSRLAVPLLENWHMKPYLSAWSLGTAYGGFAPWEFDVRIDADHTFSPLPLVVAFTHQYIGTPAAITPRPADATPGASTIVLITIAKPTIQKSAGAQG